MVALREFYCFLCGGKEQRFISTFYWQQFASLVFGEIKFYRQWINWTLHSKESTFDIIKFSQNIKCLIKFTNQLAIITARRIFTDFVWLKQNFSLSVSSTSHSSLNASKLDLSPAKKRRRKTHVKTQILCRREENQYLMMIVIHPMLHKVEPKNG